MIDIKQKVKTALEGFLAKSGAEELVLLYSGGRDSTVLLELLGSMKDSLSFKLRAIHVDHRLTDGSANQAKECARVAKERHVELKVHRVVGKPSIGQSVEEWARNQRYNYVRRQVNSRCLVLTAHHSNDQVETVIQRFAQGAGPYGLRGIVPLRKLGQGYIGRPLLQVSREDITAFARERGLNWYEDPMNYDLRFERIKIRQSVLPELETISSKAIFRLNKLAKIQGNICDILDELADSHLAEEKCLPKKLSVNVLRNCRRLLRPFVLRKALTDSGFPVPREKKLEVIISQMLEAKQDSNPVVRVGSQELRRYDGYIYLIRRPRENSLKDNTFFEWDPKEKLTLPWGCLSIEKKSDSGTGESFFNEKKLTVKFRRGGERFWPNSRSRSNELKKLFQEWRVPPWERALIPLIYDGGQLVAVAGLGIAKEFLVKNNINQSDFDFAWVYTIYD